MSEGRGELEDHVERVHARFHKLIAKAWEEADFKDQLLNDPGVVFAENDIELPPGVAVKVLENTPEAWHFVLPANCAELSEEQLVAGKLADSCVCTCCCGYTVQASNPKPS
jgi:hypothetical protein